MRFAMGDRLATLMFYNDLLGFSVLRALSGAFPGTNDSIAFYEFKDLPRAPFNLRVQDPGAPALSLRVNDLDNLRRRLRAAGVHVASARGEVVQFTPTIRNILVEDPNGIHVELCEEKR
jgi:hypothetical protein